MSANKELLDKALTLLGKFLDFEDQEEICLLVCGGAGLIIQGYISRVTEDVDIVALGNREESYCLGADS